MAGAFNQTPPALSRAMRPDIGKEGSKVKVNAKCTCLYPSSEYLVTEYVQKFLGKDLSLWQILTHQEHLHVKPTLKGLWVDTIHEKGRCKISGLSKEPLQNLLISDGSGKKISIVDYFLRTHNIVLCYPLLPAIDIGSDTDPVYLPMEVCRLAPGQRCCCIKLGEECPYCDIFRAKCQIPHVREDIIKQREEEYPLFFDSGRTCFEARILRPPVLEYLRQESGPESRLIPTSGQWDMLNQKVYTRGRIDLWTCVCFSGAVDYNKFCELVVRYCIGKGIIFSPRLLVPARIAAPSRIEDTLKEIARESSEKLQELNLSASTLDLLMVVLPDMCKTESTEAYDLIKTVCETNLGIVSQCCHPDEVSKLVLESCSTRQASDFSKLYLENLALKINVKARGGRNVNLVLENSDQSYSFLRDKETIVIGADVIHPSLGEDSSPSIAGVVASMDWPEVTMYRASVSYQGHGDEIIQDLFKDSMNNNPPGGMIRDHLIAFYERTQLLPKRIIFYRSGVSEGQVNNVMLHEVDAIKKACRELPHQPQITYIVVESWNHTRIFPAEHDDPNSTDERKNVMPGTVVDTDICHPTEFDFYLCSHAETQGTTSRPTYYHVLYDENGFTADAMQSMTNNLCYTNATCTYSMAVVPPAYYAHLAAKRARCYISDRNYLCHSGSASKGGMTFPKIAGNVSEVMFYC